MSRLSTLNHNPEGYKNFCNVFEADDTTCDGCSWKYGHYVCIIPIHDRKDVEGILECLDLTT